MVFFFFFALAMLVEIVRKIIHSPTFLQHLMCIGLLGQIRGSSHFHRSAQIGSAWTSKLSNRRRTRPTGWQMSCHEEVNLFGLIMNFLGGYGIVASLENKIIIRIIYRLIHRVLWLLCAYKFSYLNNNSVFHNFTPPEERRCSTKLETESTYLNSNGIKKQLPTLLNSNAFIMTIFISSIFHWKILQAFFRKSKSTKIKNIYILYICNFSYPVG